MEHFDHPSPHAKMVGFGLRTTSSLLWGGRELIVPFYSIQDCNLGQNEWNISTTPDPPPPPPHFNGAKMVGFGLRATSSLLWGEGG